MLVTGMNREEIRMKMMSRVMITMMITMLTPGVEKIKQPGDDIIKEKTDTAHSIRAPNDNGNDRLHRPASQRKQPK